MYVSLYVFVLLSGYAVLAAPKGNQPIKCYHSVKGEAYTTETSAKCNYIFSYNVQANMRGHCSPPPLVQQRSSTPRIFASEQYSLHCKSETAPGSVFCECYCTGELCNKRPDSGKCVAEAVAKRSYKSDIFKDDTLSKFVICATGSTIQKIQADHDAAARARLSTTVKPVTPMMIIVMKEDEKARKKIEEEKKQLEKLAKEMKAMRKEVKKEIKKLEKEEKKVIAKAEPKPTPPVVVVQSQKAPILVVAQPQKAVEVKKVLVVAKKEDQVIVKEEPKPTPVVTVAQPRKPVEVQKVLVIFKKDTSTASTASFLLCSVFLMLLMLV